MGQLFYRRVAPSEIKAMNYPELRYWADWSERISEEEKKAMDSR